MNAKFLFEQFPEAEECFLCTNGEGFLRESEAIDYSQHFNCDYKKVLREEVLGVVAGHDIKILNPVMEGSELKSVAKTAKSEAKAQVEATPPATVDVP